MDAQCMVRIIVVCVSYCCVISGQENQHNIAQLCGAADSNNIPAMKLLLNGGVNPNARLMGTDLTPLTCAIRQGNLSAVRLLLRGTTTLYNGARNNGIIVSDPNFHHYGLFESSPLALAALQDSSMVQLLLQSNADVTLKNTGYHNTQGERALLNAVVHANKRVVDILILVGVPVNCANKYGNTPLMMAVDKRFSASHREAMKKIASALLEAGADPKSVDRYKAKAPHIIDDVLIEYIASIRSDHFNNG